MSGVLKMSEAAVLAFHAMIYIAVRETGFVTNAEIASALRASEAHLAKVLQRLSKAGLVKSIRGPRGGFILGKDSGAITLRDIYELFEGSMEHDMCLLEAQVCGNNCIFGDLLIHVNDRVREYMTNTLLKDAVEKSKKGVNCS
ncbi:MAG: Rrf2 family transcriptional regulator [Candidatus Latescibacter sp.]|nr:Rrf2 family transcriptional regulator [Candidatus Latescibacter sp.]